MKSLILLPLLLMTAACGSHVAAPSAEPVIVTKEVDVPIAGACVPADLGAPPVYSDTDAALKAAADPAERYQLLWAGRSQRQSRLNQIEPIIAGCPKKK